MAAATMAAHFTATIFLLPIGLRRLFSSSSFLNNPSNFRSKIWYLSDPKWKNLDLYILTVALPIASFAQVFIFFSFPSHPSYYRFAFLNQSLLIFLYWVLILLFLFRDGIDPLTLNDSFLFLCAAVLFLLEYPVIGEGVSGLVGLAVYDLCRGLTVVCGCCCLILAVRPGAFFVEFCFCSGLVFRGTWFLQTGLSLYTDVFAFKGCRKIMVSLPVNENANNNAEVKCDLDEDGFRGVALVNLLFIGHAIGVLLLCFGVFALSSSGNRKPRVVESGGALLEGLQSDTNQTRRVPEFELE